MLSGMSPPPWIWVVEALAHSDQVNVSLLVGLLEKIPKTSNDLSRHARELVSLRILEFFSIQGASASPVSSDTSKKIGLDPSASCEDVLKRILTKRLESPSSSCLQLADLEISKWDLLPYVAHKRSSLPKMTLQQLKDAIQTGKYSFSASLKEKSWLPVGDQPEQPEHGTRIDDGNCNAIAPSFNSSDTNLLQKDLPGEIPVPVARKRSADSDTDIVGETSSDDQVFTDDGPVKKHKHDVSCSEQQDDCKSVSSGVDAQLGDASAVSTQHNEEERCNFKENVHVESVGINGVPKKAYNGCTSPEGFAGDIEVSDHEKGQIEDDIEDDIEEEVGNDGDYCNLMEKNGEQKLQDDDVDLDKSDKNIPRNSSNVDEAKEGGDVSSDSDGFREEDNTIETKRKTFLLSQSMYSQDSLSTTDCTELNLCMKCSKDGRLLVCSSDSCPLVIHESCLGSDASYDSSGKFYCPFCAYSQAISRYTDFKRNASLARKDLAAFVCIGTQKKSKDLSHRSCRIKQNHQELGAGLPESSNSKRDCADKVSNPQQAKELENEGAGPSELHPHHSLPSRGRAGPSVNKIVHGPDEGKQERRRIRTRSLRFDGKHTSTSDDPENHADFRSKKGVLCPPESDSSHQSQEASEEETESEDSEASEQNESEDPEVSKYIIRARNKKVQYTSYPVIPHMRRNKLKWTKEEEDTLQEGIRLFTDPNDRVMPWSKILEFGADVFDKSRSAVDLKDKWRNMCRATSKA